MPLTHQEEWDTEEVVTFVYDVRPWRDMVDVERTEWCRRVRFILNNVVTDGKRWTQRSLAPLFGVVQSVLSERLSWSEAVSSGAIDQDEGYSAQRQRSDAARIGDARRALRNPDIESVVKADVVADALADPEVAAAVAKRIANDPDLVRLVNQGTSLNVERRTSHSTPTEQEQAINLDTGWQGWLNRINAILIVGARLASESHESTLNAQSQLALYLYERITERKLDAEIRELLESYEVSN